MNQRPTLVVLPGLDGTGRLLAPIVAQLRPHLDLIMVSYPDLDSFTEYVDFAQKQLPTRSGFSILAESISGPIAIALMAQRPDQIGPSVLATTFARSPLAALTRLSAFVPEHMFSIGVLNELCMDSYEFSDDDPSRTQPLPFNVMEQLDGKLLQHRLSVLSRLDISALLPNIEVPILYLRAIRDRIVAERDAEMIQNHLPNVKRVDIDAPHLLLQTKPQQCADLILKHVQSGQ